MKDNILNFDVKGFVSSLSDEELCAEVLCWQLSKEMTDEEILAFAKKNKASSFFASSSFSPERIAFIKDAMKKSSKSPCLVTADVERGPIVYKELESYNMSMMNLAATGDEALAFEAGKYTARLSRALGIHLTLSPVIDINFNPLNPITNTRAAGDTADSVTYALSYGRGMRSEGRLAITPKHFPGDGVDDKNQHFCTTVNSLSREEWMASYGKLYKQVISEGAEAIMVAHIALPWYDGTEDECGYMPATLSRPLMMGLLKGELLFDGCIVSDAMSMVGTAARVPIERLSVEFLRAGGDLVLFPEKDDHERLLAALKSGYLERARLVDAAERVVSLKAKLGLFEEREYPLEDGDIEKTREIFSLIAKKSITKVRDVSGTLPLSLEKGARVLAVSLTPEKKDAETDLFPTLANELEARGFEVVRMTNPSHYEIEKVIAGVDAVFVSSYIDTTNCTGNSLRLGWNNMMTFWRGYILGCKNFVFISFGDPYKLSELPFLKTCVNAYIKSDASVKAALSACLGEEEFSGVSPVSLPK